MASIFLSHSSKDKEFVRRLADDLRVLGHSPWLDEWEIKVGECIATRVQDGIANADYVGVVLTTAAVASGWVDREWKMAIYEEIETTRVIVLPILLERCEIPGLLKTKKYARFDARYELGLAELAQTMTSVEAPKHLGAPAQVSTLSDATLDSMWSRETTAMIEAVGLAAAPTYALTALPRQETEMTDLFASKSHPLAEALRRPPTLRDDGFDLTCEADPIIEAGIRRRTVDVNDRALSLARDGVLTFVTCGDGFLAPGSWTTISSDQPLKIHPIALIESIYLFCLLSVGVYASASPPITSVVYRLRLVRLTRGDNTPTLVPGVPRGHGLQKPRSAPAGEVTLSIEATLDDSAEYNAFRIVREVYSWFGIEHDSIPFVANRSGLPVIDVNRFRLL